MTYRLGNIEIDPANFLLTADGEPVPVEPLVFDLIIYLIEHRDRLLTRQELLDELWADRIVSDTTLSNHIKSARKALGDDGHTQQVIRTVHGRGYRFVAAIEEVPSSDVSADSAAPARRRAEPRTGWPPRRLALYAVAFVVLIAISGRLLSPGPGEVVESIAVLPFKNLSDDKEQAYFVDGMQDALIARLSRTTGLRVISRTSTTRYGATEKSIPEIARELDVDAVVEGSVLRDEDRVRITAQLILGSADEHLWAGSYDRDLDHVLTLINEISLAIAEEIHVAVEPQESEQRTPRRPVDIEVHELVLKGHHYFDRFMFDKSLDYYQQAVALDAEFATAHAGVAGSYLLMEMFRRSPGEDFIPRARAAALKAIALDSNSAAGHSCLGFIQLYFDRDWEAARSNLLRALELNPNDARTRHAYADYLMVVGDVEASLNQVEIGLLYDPLSPMANSVVSFHRVLARRYDQVIEEVRQAAVEEPAFTVTRAAYQEALWLKGMHEEAFAAYKQTWGRDEKLLQAMEAGYSESGYTGAVHALAEALAARVPGFDDYVTLAKLYARAGEPDAALLWLERAYQERQPQILHVKAMPAFDGLRPNPAFQDLLNRIGFPDSVLR